MVCVQCGAKTQVVNSRHQKRANQVWRRRRCKACGTAFTTQETPDFTAIWVVRSKTGALQPFSRDKLLLSLYESCRHRKNALSDAAALTDTIVGKLPPQITQSVVDKQTIMLTAQVALNRFDKAASSHYQAYHKAVR